MPLILASKNLAPPRLVPLRCGVQHNTGAFARQEPNSQGMYATHNSTRTASTTGNPRTTPCTQHTQSMCVRARAHTHTHTHTHTNTHTYIHTHTHTHTQSKHQVQHTHYIQCERALTGQSGRTDANRDLETLTGTLRSDSSALARSLFRV